MKTGRLSFGRMSPFRLVALCVIGVTIVILGSVSKREPWAVKHRARLRVTTHATQISRLETELDDAEFGKQCWDHLKTRTLIDLV